jgi:hypothetical protein
VQKHLTDRAILYERVDHVNMALADLLVDGHIFLVGVQSHVSGLEQEVGYATKGTNYNDAIIRLLADDALYLMYAVNGTNRGSTKFEYFHIFLS